MLILKWLFFSFEEVLTKENLDRKKKKKILYFYKENITQIILGKRV